MSYQDKHGNRRWKKVLKDDRMHFILLNFLEWWKGKSPQQTLYQSCFFLETGVWRYSLRCPARSSQNAFLYRCRYSKIVRQICHMFSWYFMLTEVLACNAGRKAAKESEEHAIGRFLSWDAWINRPAQSSCSPCCLNITAWCGQAGDPPDEGIALRATPWPRCRDGSWRKEYLQRKDLFIHHPPQPVQKPGKIARNLCQQFQKPPPRRELPSPKLLRKAFLLGEAESIEDY